jgi:hypothetical protein
VKHRSLFASLMAATWIAVLFGGCGGSSSSPPASPPPGDAGDAGEATVPDDAPVDGPGDAPGDAPDDAPVTPPFETAAHTAIPLVSYHGGPILTSEQIVSVTFANEPEPTRLDQFGDGLIVSPYWHDVTSDYCAGAGSSECVGNGVSGGHVVLPETPSGTYAFSVVPGVIQAHLLDGRLPLPTQNTVYALYYPPGSVVGSCSYADAYHSYAQVTLPVPGCNNGTGGGGGTGGAGGASDGGGAGGSGGAGGAGGCAGMVGPTVDVVYAVVLKCLDDNEETLAAGHEFVEAATDPFVNAWYTDDEAYSEFFYYEVGDLCDYEPNLTENGYLVQRIWSNASAEAGHDPCIPIPPGEVYFNAAPTTNTLHLAVGEGTTLEVDAYSDAPTADWSLSVEDYEILTGMPAAFVDVSIDKTTVNNGSKATVTVKLLATPTTMTGNALFAIISNQGSRVRYWPVVVVPK